MMYRFVLVELLSMPFRSLALAKEERIAVITLDRPQEGNALSGELAQKLTEACALVSQDDGVWAVVLTATGRSFCTGGDAPFAIEAVADIEQPVIAAIAAVRLGLVE
jgi:1,4-dihydroxy-2-naphthoyl-CoA synthase